MVLNSVWYGAVDWNKSEEEQLLILEEQVLEQEKPEYNIGAVGRGDNWKNMPEYRKKQLRKDYTDPIELNEYGLALWKNKTLKTLFAERDYRWCDRILVIDESDPNVRKVISDSKFSTFDFKGWLSVTKEEYSRVKKCYSDIWKE